MVCDLEVVPLLISFFGNFGINIQGLIWNAQEDAICLNMSSRSCVRNNVDIMLLK